MMKLFYHLAITSRHSILVSFYVNLFIDYRLIVASTLPLISLLALIRFGLILGENARSQILRMKYSYKSPRSLLILWLVEIVVVRLTKNQIVLSMMIFHFLTQPCPECHRGSGNIHIGQESRRVASET